jgi:hypothetical protein
MPIITAAQARALTKRKEEVLKKKVEEELVWLNEQIVKQTEEGYFDYTTGTYTDKAIVDLTKENLEKLGFSVLLIETGTNRMVSRIERFPDGSKDLCAESTYVRQDLYKLYINWA